MPRRRSGLSQRDVTIIGHNAQIVPAVGLFVGDATPEGFKPISRAQVSGGKFWTVPVLASGRLFIRNSEGLVTCLQLGPTEVASAR